MSSISSLYKMTSGLVAGQKGLQITAHNLSNVNTKGFSRQQVLQSDNSYLNVGVGKIGMGVKLDEIRQIRDELADFRYRRESSVLNYYSTASSAVSEIESILDEPNGTSLSESLNDFWGQTQKLATSPSGVEERLSFIQTADVLAKKINHIYDSMCDYQDNLNQQVIDMTKKINGLLDNIYKANEQVVRAEINGSNANDIRDQRNNLLDDLSQCLEITYFEDKDGNVIVKSEGMSLVEDKFVTKLELKQTISKSSFVKPVWSNTGEDLYDLSVDSNAGKENDTGQLKALLLMRGDNYASNKTSWNEIALNDKISVDSEGNGFLIPKLQKKLGTFVEDLVNLINKAFDGDGIGTHAGEKGVQVIVSIDGTGDLRPGNIKINSELLSDGGYNKLGTVPTGTNDVSDNSLINEFLNDWTKPKEWYTNSTETSKPNQKTTTLCDYYAEFVAELGTQGSLYKAKAEEQNTMVTDIDNLRMAMAGVSEDEELTNMLTYQHAYNASARIINVLDGMLETLLTAF